MKPKTPPAELFKCDACGRIAKLETHKRHWCDCNPRAPFAMHSVKDARVTDGVISAYLTAIGRKGGASRSVISGREGTVSFPTANAATTSTAPALGAAA